ncbi:phosphatase [Pantoea dispersa EGD-AAK13]|uniref:sugar phosphatase n=1 Tax=Pantoea TaxID=53335 RepID=UPI00039854A4|nr:sugar phosphatase [Pantoea dispersa]ERH62427.1 phosphatase [Pantoea dispersa EGD-AAK13]MBU6518090.1 sugar phosphatase [Pantoea sp. B270]MCI1027859.1 sugar phosphatase [Pantoea dispersa]MDR6297847.1 sugar-phosphatase [Pantoea dispersa]
MKYRGFLFDLDGTLVDSLPAVNRAWSSWGARHGLAAQQVLDYIHGKPAINSLRHFMAGQSEAAIQAEFRWLEQLEAEDTAGVQAIAGAHALLATLNALDIPWAIVTSGSIPVAHARHKAAGLPLPEVFITAEDIKFGKPNPEPYLLGAERLGLSAPECVVVEDAPAGIIAGLEAGSAVVAVNPPADAPRLSEVALQVENLQPLHISKQPDGYFSVTLRA